ncbi:hypothetical protein O181_074137 [Austropuccinia psidii MF-1]|uniref:Reverse transcriptase Ty1/copia-type domain-containing protein n=1 Tax=Austropuccinia psidii MF-1 TaxID=1389203 RepID=A0A9Q3FCH8_9BASI|nr:hypothetical protein [Austropuccinia psidii MF-1]
MEKDLQNDTNANENNLNIDVSLSEDENEDVFIDALQQKPQRIRVIGPRHPTLISRKINCKNILQFSQRQPRANITNQTCSTPKSFNEAMSGSNKEDWNAAIKKELMNMERLNVWTLREKTTKNHPITSMWVFKEKQDNTGNTVEYKAHLCAHSFHQILGLDNQSTFAPTGRLSSLRALISFATIHKYEFHQMDVQSAVLNAPLQEGIFLEIPLGVSENKETHVLHLKKALYGLKQASLSW